MATRYPDHRTRRAVVRSQLPFELKPISLPATSRPPADRPELNGNETAPCHVGFACGFAGFDRADVRHVARRRWLRLPGGLHMLIG